MKCENTECGSYDPEWLFNCANLAVGPGKSVACCPDFKTCAAEPEQTEGVEEYKKTCRICGESKKDYPGIYCLKCKSWLPHLDQTLGPEQKQTTAPKNNIQEGKAKMHLIPLDLLREFLVPAYEEGLIKYFEESWRLGFKMSDMMDGLLRHMDSFYYQGEDLDKEALEKYGIEKTHLGAALFCILCMCNTMKNYPELDDRVGNKDYKELADKVEKEAIKAKENTRK